MGRGQVCMDLGWGWDRNGSGQMDRWLICKGVFREVLVLGEDTGLEGCLGVWRHLWVRLRKVHLEGRRLQDERPRPELGAQLQLGVKGMR